ncbi:putative ribonuclease H-like domain-containing protein [Tanacetum coccineum]|uniref:Ribonuclease H-like domain-containing protein n=1 Tax=Tanacetum coccineum TaxID=301880 RepID=A0ABQ4WG28_9ASTR
MYECQSIPTSRINSIHPSTLILGDPQSVVQTRSKVTKSSGAHAFILVDLPYRKKAIGTKWVYKNKKDEKGVVVRNKARLVAQKSWCDEFEALMKSRFQMSSMGELTFFLGLQVKQKEDVDACSRFQGHPKTSHLSAVKRIFRHLDAKKKLVMYPRFISIFLDKQLMNVPVPLDHFPVNALTKEIGRKPSERTILNTTSTSPLSTQRVSRGNQGGQSSSDKSLSGMRDVMELQSGRKSTKAEPSVHKDPIFDELADDTLDYMDTENAQDVGRTRNVVYEEKESAEDAVSTEDVVSTDKEKVSTDRSKVSIDRSRVSTDKEKDSTDRPDEGIVDQTKGRSATPTTPTTTTPTTFGDDEAIAQVLLNMSQAKAVQRKKRKPLPKIDPKDKGKKKIEEEDESDTESEGILEAEKKFKQLARDEEMARKVQEDWEAEEEVTKLAEEEATNLKEGFLQNKELLPLETDHLQELNLGKVEKRNSKKEDSAKVFSLRCGIMEKKSFISKLDKVSSPKGDYLVIYKANGNFRAFNYLLEIGRLSLEDCKKLVGVYILELEDGIVIHMLVERRYPLPKDLLQRMLDLGLEVERESTAALDLIKFIKQQIDEE